MQGITICATIGAMPRPRSKSEYSQAFLEMLGHAGFATPYAAAKAAGAPDMLRDVARGKSRTVRSDSLAALAAVLGRSVEEVSDALGLRSREPQANREMPTRLPVRSAPLLPVRYEVKAGAWIERDELAQAPMKGPPVSADPAYPADAQWLELVRGDSMDLFYPEGSWVHVIDAIAIGYQARDEDFVTIERKRQQGGLIERSLKQVALKRGKVELWPRSRNPRWNGPLPLGAPRDDEDEVRIAALVIGGYLPARR